MISQSPFHPRFEDLPPLLPVFPLPKALVLPWGRLPLNIFEPRYLAMVEDCLAVGRLIGMIQPQHDGVSSDNGASPHEAVPLARVGCAGRVSSFTETNDGRFLITLTGVCRFQIREERPLRRGYRVVTPEWQPFAADLEPMPVVEFDRPRLMTAVQSFFRQNNLPLNLRVMEEMAGADLVTALSMLCPFAVAEKQALLEAIDGAQRVQVLQALLEMASYDRNQDPRSCQ